MGLADAVGGVISGVLNKGGVSAPDLTALFNTIKNAGENQKDMINALPAEIKPLYDQYIASTNAAGTALQTGTTGVTQGLLDKTSANYGPEVAKAEEDAAKTAIYANLPGQQAAIREALAATGGFDRGTASKQLAAPVLQAGQAVSQNVANVEAQQLQAKQAATQQAINTVASMDEATLNNIFGMSKEQATAILQGNRQDLKDQLTSLVNQSVNQTNQTLGVQGADITNKYNQAVAQKAQQDAFNNSLVNLGTSAANSLPGFLSGMGIPDSTGYAPPSYAPQSVNLLP